MLLLSVLSLSAVSWKIVSSSPNISSFPSTMRADFSARFIDAIFSSDVHVETVSIWFVTVPIILTFKSEDTSLQSCFNVFCSGPVCVQPCCCCLFWLRAVSRYALSGNTNLVIEEFQSHWQRDFWTRSNFCASFESSSVATNWLDWAWFMTWLLRLPDATSS